MAKRITKYLAPFHERRLKIAYAIINDPSRPLKQIAAEFNVSYAVVSSVFREYIEVQYTLKFTEKPTEQGSDKELPE